MQMKRGHSVEFPATVVALSIFDLSGGASASIDATTKMQVVVRDPISNVKHPNVISVPTQRVPEALIRAMVNTVDAETEDAHTTYYRGPAVDVSVRGHHPIVFAVESILARKLEVASDLELGRIKYQALLRAISVGKSHYPNLPAIETEEYVLMANIMVLVTSGAELFPKQTTSYSHILWIDVKDFLTTVHKRNPLEIGLDPFEYCIHGLCISTTHDVITNNLLPLDA
jgi:hypothetical protein